MGIRLVGFNLKHALLIGRFIIACWIRLFSWRSENSFPQNKRNRKAVAVEHCKNSCALEDLQPFEALMPKSGAIYRRMDDNFGLGRPMFPTASPEEYFKSNTSR
jgi:hypothetical protein